MKKYSIYDLYVVKVQRGGETYFFICKYNKYKDIYVEFFTGEKLGDGKNISTVLLALYYPILGRRNLETGTVLMVDKGEILRKLIEINENFSFMKESKRKNREVDSDTIKILEEATRNFFPKTGAWSSVCFGRDDTLQMENLPGHLHDDMWLSKMLKKTQELHFLDFNDILSFVRTSNFFHEKIGEYEQKVVEWQINWMNSGGENYLVSDEYGGDFIFLSPEYDLGFRKGVVDTLRAIGLDEQVIEEGIEKNSGLWRDNAMLHAFRNAFESVFITSDFTLAENKQEVKNIEPVDSEFREKWLKYRKYEYYKRHKEAVDKYGVVEDDMVMSDFESAELKSYLDDKIKERKRQIEEYKEEMANVRRERGLRKELRG